VSDGTTQIYELKTYDGRQVYVRDGDHTLEQTSLPAHSHVVWETRFQREERRVRAEHQVGKDLLWVLSSETVKYCEPTNDKFASSSDELEKEVTRLRDRGALMEQLLGEALRHGYLKPDVSPSWLEAARRATERV
jgi:hypothetical protein